ncbi:zinc finger HIT domain-containing protein [Microdochium nivale]|nr:zinc finger HIT domain-containing protein [Microdochium nivale]
MADPLLTSLCTICHVQSPKYKCPRCATRTCSLQCIKKHKKWSSCSGERDPTVYLAPSKLKTDAGIDHDYNFLTKIERSIETADKIMREERDIVPPPGGHPQQQHNDASGGRHQHRDNHHPNKRARFNDGRHGHDEHSASASSRRWDKNSQFRLRKLGIHVSTVPYGMTRSRENKTSWNKRTRTINWQVEWFVHAGAETASAGHEQGSAAKTEVANDTHKPTRILHKILDETPLVEGFEAGLAWYRHTQMTEEERALEKITKKKEEHSKTATKMRREVKLNGAACGQDPLSSSWTAHFAATQSSTSSAWQDVYPETRSRATTSQPIESAYQFFYQKPRIPSRQTQKLTPLDPEDDLAKILPRLEIVEFPAIHVFPKGVPLPEGYALDQPSQKQRQMPVRPQQGGRGENGKRKAEGLVGYGSSGEDDDNDDDDDDVEPAATGQKEAEEDAADTTSSAESSDEESDEPDLDMAGA